MPPERGGGGGGGGGKDLSSITAEIIVAVLITLIILAVFGGYIDTLLGWYNAFLQWLYSKDWPNINRGLAVIFSLVNLGIIIFIANTIKEYRKTNNSYETPPSKAVIETVTPKTEVKENWEHIQELISSTSPSDWNMAVLRADALIDDILMHMGYEGETMAERLKIVDPHKIPSMDRLWSAHRLRNAIAHDPLEQHTKENLEYAIKTYEQALVELGLMEKEPKT